MKLTELEHKSELVDKAMQDGINTVEEFSIWLIGYRTGYADRNREVIERIKQGVRDEMLIL